ncbi:hypothetical protein RvY_17973 [Ramazzottius varieornatus]|uniref:Uncharacterized protein n=1 Tax=Ramazzottius varieornatus TaxID=947166 RepID=A0A1D1W434_RAMVA|nr:hypothetical protein RvY_17973 [Ramazzottius varieornatus]
MPSTAPLSIRVGAEPETNRDRVIRNAKDVQDVRLARSASVYRHETLYNTNWKKILEDVAPALAELREGRLFPELMQKALGTAEESLARMEGVHARIDQGLEPEPP